MIWYTLITVKEEIVKPKEECNKEITVKNFYEKVFVSIFNGDYEPKRSLSLIENMYGKQYQTADEIYEDIMRDCGDEAIVNSLIEYFKRHEEGFGGFTTDILHILGG